MLIRLAKGLHFTRKLSVFAGRHPHSSRVFSPRGFHRRLGTNAYFVSPKITFFRLVLTGGATAVGYMSYKVKSFSEWVQDTTGSLGARGLQLLQTLKDDVAGLLSDVEYRRNPGKRVLETDPEPEPVTDASSDASSAAASLAFDLEGAADFNSFIKRMIEIREILRAAGTEDAVALPNIVVIGSQSSGKSSVLENIVGHEFLPKGQNMVTRRPLELTLIHTSAAERERVVIHGHGYGPSNPIYDFKQVQAVLRDLNMSVSAEDWVSEAPIQASIYSPNVPDLTLVDLPGYIQVTNRSQPPILREKIRKLCDQYIRRNNLILAVCAADVDLANAEALKASRQYDPIGERTIGVITKLDLIEPELAANLIANQDYPLLLGYVGVVCKPPGSASQSAHEGSLLKLVRGADGKPSDFEREYFQRHSDAFASVQGRIGFGALRRMMTGSLEAVLAQSLGSVVEAVEDELAELKYQMKVQYNDRVVSPEAYVADMIASLKRDFNQLTRLYTRGHVRETLQKAFRQRLLQLCDEHFWSAIAKEAQEPACTYAQLRESRTLADEWDHRLSTAMASFTRSGVGRSTANMAADGIMAQVYSVLSRPPFTFHASLQAKLGSAAEIFLKKRCHAAIDQVENSMKPFKHGIEFTPIEWRQAQVQLMELLKESEKDLRMDLEKIKRELGAKRLRRAVEFLGQQAAAQDDPAVSFDPSSNPILLRAQEAVAKSVQLKRLQSRLQQIKAIKERQPLAVHDVAQRSSLFTRIQEVLWNQPPSPDLDSARLMQYESNSELVIFRDPCQLLLPEVYLFMMMDRFLATCSTFVHYELVNEFLQPFPDDIVSGDGTGILSLSKMSPGELRELLRENPAIAQHLQMQDRFRALEQVSVKLNELKRANRSLPANGGIGEKKTARSVPQAT